MNELCICASCGEERPLYCTDEYGEGWCMGCWIDLQSAMGGYDSNDIDEEGEE